MSMIAKNRIKSAWTPLSNEETNNKMFEERKDLVIKWFSKWNDDQRQKIFDELVGMSKRRQLNYARELIDTRSPCTNDDFTRVLPRVISLYIFSYLDAKSLCQCAQVCWYWRYLSELDQLWMSKCLHFGWYLTFTPSPYENGVWKRNFIEKFRIIRAAMPKHPHMSEMSKLTIGRRGREKSSSSSISGSSSTSTRKKNGGTHQWKGSDPVPQDIWRYNYLNNDETVHDVAKRRHKKVYGSSVDDMIKNAKSKINTGTHVLNSLSKSQSLTNMNGSSKFSTSDRPRWARQGPQPTSSSQYQHKDAMKQNGVLAKITRPGPISSPPPPKMSQDLSTSSPSKPVTARSARDPPSTNLFPESPWKIPTKADSDDEN